jgi:outer membrane lipopolysaccharide assembly protein LptE/RlpB
LRCVQPTALVLLILLALLLSACGYHFPGGGSSLPPHIKTIAVPVFGNQTQEVGVENDFTNQVVFEFTRSGILKVLAPPADATLKGKIQAILVSPVAYSAQVVATERRVTLRLSVSLVETATGKVLWQDGSMVDTEVFPVAADALSTETARREAIRRIAERMTLEIHNRALENF